MIPASDERPTLADALAAVEASAQPGDDVIVARNGDGPAATRNRGAQQARGEIIVFVDSDVRVHPDAFARIRTAFGDDPELTALFGAYDDDPACRQTVSQFRNLLHHHVHRRAAGEATTFWAGLGAIRREAFEASGGFDAALHPHAMEDVELGMRLCDAGARIVLDPQLRGKHLKRWTFAGMVRSDLADRGVPWVRMLLRRGAGLERAQPRLAPPGHRAAARGHGGSGRPRPAAAGRRAAARRRAAQPRLLRAPAALRRAAPGRRRRAAAPGPPPDGRRRRPRRRRGPCPGGGAR